MRDTSNSNNLRIVACISAYNEECTIAKKVVLKAMEYIDRVMVCDDGSIRHDQQDSEEARCDSD